LQDSLAKKQNTALTDLILHAPQFFTSLTLFLKMRLTYQNAKAEDLLKPMLKTDFAKKQTCQKKTNLAKKPEPNLTKLLLKTLKPISET